MENRENDISGVKKCLFGGLPWNHLNGGFGAFNSLPIEGGNSTKKAFFDPKKCHFPDFPILTSVGGPWDRNSRHLSDSVKRHLGRHHLSV